MEFWSHILVKQAQMCFFLLRHLVTLFNYLLSLRLVGAMGARNHVGNSFSQ